jgi:hypothetical protein
MYNDMHVSYQAETHFDCGALLFISGAVAGVVPLVPVPRLAALLFSAPPLEYLPSRKHTTAANSK